VARPDLTRRGKKGVEAEATFVFLDEVGSSLKGLLGMTWAPIGQTPVLETCCNWKNLSTIGAITPQGEVFEQSYPHSIKSSHVTAFLQHLADSIPAKLVVFCDNARIHTSYETKSYIQQNLSDRLTLVHMPSYAPEFNPIEWLWAWIKKNFISNLCPKTLQQLQEAWQRAFSAARAAPELIHSFFRASAVGSVLQIT
jgi:putative transposase